MTVYMFVDSIHGENNVDHCSQTGILIFMNKYSIRWYSKKQSSDETSTFGAKLCAMKVSVEMVEALVYKLRVFGVPLDGAASVFCGNEAVYKKTAVSESTLRNKYHYIAYKLCSEAVAVKVIRIEKQVTKNNLSDLFTKV